MQHECCLLSNCTLRTERNPKEAATMQRDPHGRQRKMSGPSIFSSSLVTWIDITIYIFCILKQQKAYLSYKILYIAKIKQDTDSDILFYCIALYMQTASYTTGVHILFFTWATFKMTSSTHLDLTVLTTIWCFNCWKLVYFIILIIPLGVCHVIYMPSLCDLQVDL